MVSYLQVQVKCFKAGLYRHDLCLKTLRLISYMEEKQQVFLSLLWKHETEELCESHRHWESVYENMLLNTDLC